MIAMDGVKVRAAPSRCCFGLHPGELDREGDSQAKADQRGRQGRQASRGPLATEQPGEDRAGRRDDQQGDEQPFLREHGHRVITPQAQRAASMIKNTTTPRTMASA